MKKEYQYLCSHGCTVKVNMVMDVDKPPTHMGVCPQCFKPMTLDQETVEKALPLSLYTLDNKQPKPCEDVRAWLEFLKNNERACVVARHTYKSGIKVESRFLGVGYAWVGEHKLFVTRVYGGPNSGKAHFSSTWGEALGHHNTIRAEYEPKTGTKRNAWR